MLGLESNYDYTPRMYRRTVFACVQMDGGRFQERERFASQTPAPKTLAPENSESDSDSNNDGFWCEYKAGILMSMTSEEHEADPCPELPATFMDPGKMREIAREISQL